MEAFVIVVTILFAPITGQAPEVHAAFVQDGHSCVVEGEALIVAARADPKVSKVGYTCFRVSDTEQRASA